MAQIWGFFGNTSLLDMYEFYLVDWSSSWVLKTVFYRLATISQVAILLISYVLISLSCCPKKLSSYFWRSRLLGILWSLVSFWDKCYVFFLVTDDSSLSASASQYSCVKIMGKWGGNSLNNKTSDDPVNSGFSVKVDGSQMLPDLFPVVFTWMVALLPSPFAESFPTSVWHFIGYYLWGLCKCSLSSTELWICGATRKVLGSEEYKTTLLIAPKVLPFSKVNKCCSYSVALSPSPGEALLFILRVSSEKNQY